MKMDHLLRLVGDLPWFDLPTILQINGERQETREAIVVQLHRWCKAGRLLSLKRGFYTFAPEYRRAALNPAALANALYPPSYLSLQWALGFYGLIPERVITHTSVTSRQTKHFDNAAGAFQYRHVKPALFFGSVRMTLNGANIRMASPEKALLDFFYLESGDWSSERMAAMRFQNQEMVDAAQLEQQAGGFDSPRILAAVDLWKRQTVHESEGTLDL